MNSSKHLRARFEQPLPLSTAYGIEIGVGFVSAANAPMTEPYVYEWETSRNSVSSMLPRGYMTIASEEIFTFILNQPCNSEKFASLVKINTSKLLGMSFYCGVMPWSDASADPVVVQRLTEAGYPHWPHVISVKPLKPLPAETEIQVVVDVGLPSEFGSLKSESNWSSIKATTYPSFGVRSVSWRPAPQITFTHPLSHPELPLAGANRVEWIPKLDPLPEGAFWTPDGSDKMSLKVPIQNQPNMAMSAQLSRSTRYTLTIPQGTSSLIYGQSMLKV